MEEQDAKSIVTESGELTEAAAFVLYWTQFFNDLVDTAALEHLWRMPRVSGRPGGTGGLPFKALLDRNYLTWTQKGPRIFVEFNRKAFSPDQMQEVLTANGRHDWAVSVVRVKDLMPKALLSMCEMRGYGRQTEYALQATLGRNLLFRWDLRTCSRIATRVYSSYTLWDVVKTLADDASIEAFRGKSLRKWKDQQQVPGQTHQRGVYTDILEWPKGISKDLLDAYKGIRMTPWHPRMWALLRGVALEEASYLRAGTSPFEEETEAELDAVLASEDFLRGLPTKWAIARLNDLRKRVPLTPWATTLLQALAFWNGDLDTASAVQSESPFCAGHPKSVAADLAFASKQNFSLAGGELNAALGVPAFGCQEYWTPVDLPILLVFLVCRLLTPQATPNGVNRAVWVFLDCAVRIAYRDLTDADPERHPLTDASWCKAFAYATGHGFAEALDPDMLDCMPEYMPFKYLRSLVLLKGARNVPPLLPSTLDFALEMQKNGYRAIAADVAASVRLIADEASDEERASALAALEASDIDPSVSFVAPRKFQSAWERGLEALAKSLGGTTEADAAQIAKAHAAEPESEVSWGISIVDRTSAPTVARVYPLVRKRLKSGNLGQLKVCSDKAFITGELDEFLSPEDREIKSLVVGGGMLVRDSYTSHSVPTVAVLRLLAKCPRLYVCYGFTRNYWERTPKGDDFEEVRLDFSEVKLDVRTTQDGGGEVYAPISFDDLKAGGEYNMTPDAEEKGLWHVFEITGLYRAAAKAISDLTRDGQHLRVPAEGLGKLEGLYASVADKAPIRWSKATAEAASDVPREATQCVPCVRLLYKDGALTAALAVRLSTEPPWTAEPGKGLPERLVIRADKSRVLLTRDFAAEEKAAQPVRAVFAPFEAARVGEAAVWVFDGVEDALTALAVLHEASLDLEWPEGEALKISSLVSHSARFEGGETSDYWLGVTGEFKLDDGKILSFTDLLRSFDSREGSFVKLTEGRYLRLTAALARRVEALKAAGVERNGKILISPAALPSLEKAARETEADDVLPLPDVVRQRIETIRDAFGREFPEPRGFKCQMRPYQEEGYQWLSRLAACGIGACLADDMGLGKTIEVIALLASRKVDGPSLVVVPASVTFNWRNEIARFAPTMRVALVGQASGAADEEDVAALAASHDVVVTSYGVLTTREEKFAAVSWNVVALDEAQAIKNNNTHRAKSVKALKAKFRVVATGTPIENRLSELWSIFDFINPGMLGGEARFARELAPHGLATPRLKRLVKPLILRRLKRDVLTDLPDKEEITVPVVLDVDERHAYEAIRQNAVKKLEEGDRDNRIAILAELTRLRRFCCHPSLVMPSMLASAKLDALEALLGDLKASGHRALVFSQFVDYLSIVRKMIERNGWTYQYLDGATAKSAREKAVEAFQSGEGDFFVISLKAGGMGLNLTAANYVILLDPWWNPAVENQATDRAHRIGQRLPVTVYRLIAQGTIEEKVVRLHEKKTALAEDVLADGASALSAQAMLELLEG